MKYNSTDNRTIEWDAENRPVSISVDGVEIASFVYDGDGNRIKKTESGNTTVYINRYFELNLTTENATSSYYLSKSDLSGLTLLS